VSLGSLGRLLLVAGLVLVLAGCAFVLLERAGVTRLPGDIVWRGERTTVYIPLGLSLLGSLILTIVVNLLLRK
jgi:hypothetical protein